MHGSEGGQAEMLSGLGKKDEWLESLREGSSLGTVSGLLYLSMVYSGSNNCPNVCMFCIKLNTL